MTQPLRVRSSLLGALALAMAAIALTADTLAMSSKPVHATRAVERKLRSAEGMDALVADVLKDIGEQRLAAAHERLDRLIEAAPNFRLAQLIKGDLLMARVRPLDTLGSAPGGPEDRLSDLREEARARLRRQALVVPGDRLPDHLLRMAPDQKYALLVDTSRSTLFVFENRDGVPRYRADYYITIGRNGVDKAREGDKRTPLGVYHVTANLPRRKLSDFYGSGAYPISYPNEWDRQNGRKGHGIWLHGTPSDTYSRPPRASDGCVVLSNQDLETIGQFLQVGVTPVVIAPDVKWLEPGEALRARSELETAIEQWRRDWESRDTESYLAHYAAVFTSGAGGLAEWAAQKRQVNRGKDWVKLRFDNVSLFLYPGQSSMAVATFTQDYRSSNLSNVMKKRVYWIREDGRWKIIHETAA